MPSNVMSDLVNLLPPPAAPLDYDPDWLDRNQGVLRIELPADFVEFGKLYGSGQIKSAYGWEVWSPFRPTYPQIVLEFARIWFIFKDAMEIDDVPFGIFPEEGGILPFASTDNGDWVCWITQGAPDSWTVIDMYNYEEGQYESFDMSFSEYWVNVLSRKIVLERHQGGDSWDPATDLKFHQVVYHDQNLIVS